MIGIVKGKRRFPGRLKEQKGEQKGAGRSVTGTDLGS